MASTIERAAEGLARAVTAFAEVSGDVEAAGLFLEVLGWSLPPGVDDIGLTKLDFSTLASRLDALDTLRAQDSPSDVDLAAALAAVISSLADTLNDIEQVAAGLELTADYRAATGLPGALFARALNHFIIHGVGSLSAGAAAIATLLGLFEFTHFPDDPTIFQVEHIRQNVRWDRVEKLLTDPASLLRDVYGWGTPTFLANALLMNLGRVLEYCAAEARMVPLPPAAEQLLTGEPAPQTQGNFPAQLFVSLDKGAGIGAYDVGLTLYPLRPTSAGSTDGGIGLSPYAFGTTQASFDLSDTLELQLSGSESIEGGLALLLRAGKSPRLLTGLLAAGASTGTFRLALGTTARNGERTVLFSAPNIVVDARAIRAGVGIDAGAATLDPSLVATIEDGRILLTPDSSDGFLGEILPADGISIALDLDASWSRQNGLRLKGGGGLSTSIVLQQKIGPLSLQALSLAIDATTTALNAAVGVTGAASIGPVTATVDAVGASIALRFDRGNLGAVDLSSSFLPPRGVGLSVDAEGVVTGSGFLYHDPAQGTYVGALQLTLHEALTLTALGLIATRLPDGSPGYSLLVFITAEDFKPIPLGLGFTLQGIGGLLAINRTFDENVVREGLKSDTLKTLLFPKDPVANALAIVRTLESAFPARRGSYLLGLLARICWGTPTILQFDLALILELGARERLLALGRITALLPSPDNALLRVKLDALGVLDFDEGTIALDAVLVDSRLVQKFAITGAGALRAGWGKGPGHAFLLSVGGFNPRFVPPPGVPALPRVAIALSTGDNPRLSCEAYFALTANTVQFGARAQLYASAIGFALTGDIGFDVLFDSPVHFVADFQSSVQLKHGSTNLFKVSVQGTLEGLLPLRLSGKASFEILWCDVTVRFHATLVDGASAAVAAVDVLVPLMAALVDPGNWSTQLPANTTHGVALRKVAPGTGSGVLLLDPLGRLAVTQTLVPLATGRDLDLFNGAPVSGAKRFSVTAALGGGGPSRPSSPATTIIEAATADFAPAQFFAMTEDEKLASPSFEEMQAGLAIGSNAVASSASQLVAAPLTYDSFVIDALPAPATSPNGGTIDQPVTPIPAAAPYVLPAAQLALHAATGAAARAPVRQRGRARYRVSDPPLIALAAPRWAVVAATTGTAVPVDESVTTWSDYKGVADSLDRGGATYDVVAVP